MLNNYMISHYVNMQIMGSVPVFILKACIIILPYGYYNDLRK